MVKRFHSFTGLAAKLRGETGQALAEYALVVTLIAMFAVVSLRAIGISVTEPLNDIAAALGGA
jgi:Flp pilus assembly pilin Flp